MNSKFTGAKIRQDFIDFFVEQRHTFVPSSPLVPGGDSTLLFTNAGMVQFKDIFLGLDHRPYSRAANSQKCMRVAGKHNDLDDVGRDNTHHTFFEMLGNWSFGDYYKREAITWAWQLLTEVWGLSKDRMWATCFRDDIGDIPQDDEAADEWHKQPGMLPEHILYFGRKDNFWEMAETGPCGPCSEIHYDRGPDYCNKQGEAGHTCEVNGDCTRFLELWNLVFIQYNRLGPVDLEPLPAKHVDTGMGLERIVSVLQDVDSNYRTDLLSPMMDAVQQLTGHTDQEREVNLTPYRVIADHSRAAAFLIADGVVPGNIGRNYIARMIIRRAARFGQKIGLNEPFLAQVAQAVINNYSEFYPELRRNHATILDNLTREEQRFQRTVEAGVAKLENLLTRLKNSKIATLPGEQAFDLYATYGLPVEITRDIAREMDLDVDESGFRAAMEEHRLASGAGEVFGIMGGEQTDIYRSIMEELVQKGELPSQGVYYDPYSRLEVHAPVLSILRNGQPVARAEVGDEIEVILPETCFYVESGGQVSDIGVIKSNQKPFWEVAVENTRKPAAGVIVHFGKVVTGTPKTGDLATAKVAGQRRQDIMRNHTATHLLHRELRAVLGEHARQAGSLVAPDRLRFDFTHPDGLTPQQLEQIEAGVNQKIFGDYNLQIAYKPLQQAIAEGAIALFGEKYSETVRNITIGDPDPFSNELCGGTHVESTGDIGVFLITSEGSTAAGIRRIEAVTGRGAYELIQRRFKALRHTASVLSASLEDVPVKAENLHNELATSRKQITALRRELVEKEFIRKLDAPELIHNVPVLTVLLPDTDADTLRLMADQFRQSYPTGVAVLASVYAERPLIVASVSDNLLARGINAVDLVRFVAAPIGGSGGGKPTLAQAGGKDANKLGEALSKAHEWLNQNLK